MMVGGVRRMLRRLRRGRVGTAPILFRRTRTTPEAMLMARAGVVMLLIGAVFAVFLLDRAGLKDNIDGHVSVSDVLYFTMITITTVGYGDIVPVSDQARLIDAFFVTPVRIFVWLVFLGTAYEMIIKQLIEEWQMTRLQRELQDHVVLCGYGDSGAVAAEELRNRGWDPERIIVIDERRDAVERAAARGYVGLHGSAGSEEMLRVAGAPRARAVIVSVGRDDTTVLIVLTLREIANKVRVIASVGQQENVKLVRASGADVIVSPASFGGHLMADAVESRGTVAFVSELLTYHGDYQVQEREPRAAEIGCPARDLVGSLIVEIRRGEHRIRAWEDRTLVIERGDRLLVIDSESVLSARA
jgi:voltage-gated potassium channel